MGNVLVPIALTFLTVFALWALWYLNSRAEHMLERWCRHTGLDLLSRECCWVGTGPYAMAPLNGQWVYRISIRNRAGRVKTGYVRIGSTLLGVLAEEVDVLWDA